MTDDARKVQAISDILAGLPDARVKAQAEVIAGMAATIEALKLGQEMFDRRLFAMKDNADVDEKILERHNGRLTSLESTLARIEDMLTTERDNKSLVDLGTGEKVAQAYPEVHQPPDIALSDPAAAGCNCRTCQRERAELRARIEAAAVLSAPAFPSFLGFMIAVDPSLAEGVIEFRDNTGNVLGTFKAEKRA
jgi:hypothetical protein